MAYDLCNKGIFVHNNEFQFSKNLKETKAEHLETKKSVYIYYMTAFIFMVYEIFTLWNDSAEFQRL